MSAALTPFQLWSLFLMLNNPSQRYTSRNLLLSCCDSAIKTLSAETVEIELSSLQSAKYIESGFNDMFINGQAAYRISNDGILFVRKNLSFIQDACNKGAIPESVIGAQENEVAEALRANSSNLAKTIIDHGIKNIGNIPMLLEACKRALECA